MANKGGILWIPLPSLLVTFKYQCVILPVETPCTDYALLLVRVYSTGQLKEGNGECNDMEDAECIMYLRTMIIIFKTHVNVVHLDQ